MAIGGTSGTGAGQLLQIAQNTQRLNEQASRRNSQTTSEAKHAVEKVINVQIQNQQRSVSAGEINLRLGSIINTTA